MFEKISGRVIATAVLRHFLSNSTTYFHILGALLTEDYLTACFYAKKLFIKTAFQFLIAYIKSRKDKN